MSARTEASLASLIDSTVTPSSAASLRNSGTSGNRNDPPR